MHRVTFIVDTPTDQRRPTILLSFRIPNDDILHGILDAAHEFGWGIVDTKPWQGQWQDYIRPVGAITDYLPDDPIFTRLQALNCPAVRVGALPHPADHIVPAVIGDLYLAGALTAEYLARLNFHHLGFVGHGGSKRSLRFLEGFQARGQELGCHLSSLLFAQSLDGAAVFVKRNEEFLAWLERQERPLGLFIYNPEMASRFSALCIINGWVVPREVAIICQAQETYVCESAPIPISSISMDLYGLGRLAAKRLKRLIDGDLTNRGVEYCQGIAITERQSTDMIAVNHPMAAAAVRFIWDNVEEPLSVDSVVEAVGASRRSLERIFAREVGRGVNAEIRRKKLEHCAYLIRTTDKSINSIAHGTGFGDSSYFYRSFRSAYGCSPQEYRERHGTRRTVPEPPTQIYGDGTAAGSR